MGFFGGKKNKEKDKEPADQPSQRKSRRIVAPGAKPGTSAEPAAPAAPAGNKTAVIKPGAPRPAGKPPGTDSSRIMGPPSRPAPSVEPVSNLISTPPQRPKGKDPITMGSSKPPEFSGGLNVTARRGTGPCRTGDAALLDFLQNKANLLNDEQVGAVRGKADQDGLPIDVAAVQLGFITEEQMVNALTQECWVPHLKVDKYEIRKKALDTVAREDASHYGVFPVDKLGSLLTMAMVNPLDAETIRVLEAKTGLDIKKVVATRTEITQGIEKYYSGQVQAKEGTLAFSQDVEPKSVTQMMSKVAPSAPPPAPPSRPMPAVAAAQADNIVPEIQDIDDLLSSDEAIAPAIIEPISLKAEAEIIPVDSIPQMEPMPAEPELAMPTPSTKGVRTPSAEFTIDDIPSSQQAAEPTLTRKPAAAPPITAPPPLPKAAPPTIAPEFELDNGPTIKPPAPTAPSRPAAPPAARPPVAPPATSSFARNEPRSATSRFTGTGRTEKSGVINLIPVTEEEFHHAITHGKSHVFEKWIGLQSRNRIINAVVVDSEFDGILAGLYAGARQV
jgi:hypothetical protein